MFKVVTLITLLLWLPHEIKGLRACTPNTQFVFNNRLCFCDNRGYWKEANCKTISRRQSCQPGQIIWQGCNQCICQENGYLVCSNSHCSDDVVNPPVLRQGLSVYGLRCTPFRSYYINCSICFCPASGVTNEAHCVKDISCNQSYRIEFGGINKIYCIPKVMYLSQCMQCLCPEHGYFDAESCTDKCKQATSLYSPGSRCNPGTFYRKGCNVCKCPENAIADDSLCVSAECNNVSLHALRTDIKSCIPHVFTVPRCMYCNCHISGEVNENACIELDCTKLNQLGNQDTGKLSCHPGEMMPICIECFCTRDGQTMAKYCSRICSYQNRMNILESVLRGDFDFIDGNQIKRIKENEQCTPNSLYLDSGRYCLCPENGNMKFKFCTSVTEELKLPESLDNHEVLSNNIDIDYNAACEPNTLVEFDCNTCYCTKNGKIDPKWCTYDDCEVKRLIQEAHKMHNPAVATDASGTCQLGAVSKLKCNFCICPESGILREKACTQNDCTEFDLSMYEVKLTCEPLAYYEVDCNICYCPRDGIKNVARCTKNLCEKNVLRSDSCVPGQLFSYGCNLCVCPPDGNKTGKACTNHVCPEVVVGKLFKFSDDLSDNHLAINYSRSLDQCFPGEEFVEGCKLCICPELGLKVYATCEAILCDEKRNDEHETAIKSDNKLKKTGGVRSKRSSNDCYLYNITTSAERKECTPGSMYIVRCRECICPYFGNINNFCRPLPKNMYCEQAFPYFNYKPMGRREINGEVSKLDQAEPTGKTKNKETNTTKSKQEIQIRVKHDKHTEYSCGKPGTILDKCFICNCEERNVVIEEHCFKSDALGCENAKPTFLFKDNLDLN